MTRLLFLLPVVGYLTACQQSAENQTTPQTPADSPARSRVEYKLVHMKTDKYNDITTYYRAFEAEVNRQIADGWQPVGGVAAVGMAGMHVQAMARSTK